MSPKLTFTLGILLCLVGFAFIGLGILFFPLSIYLLTRGEYRPTIFALFIAIAVAGFSISLYLDIQFITQKFF